MLRDRTPQGTFSQGDFNQLETGKSIKKVLIYIINYLNDFKILALNDNITNESGLNSKFVIVMNSKNSNEMFYFHHENPEDHANGNSPRVDIGIYAKSDTYMPFFVIEGKRLDKSIQNYTTRKKEYVVNNNGGGIERFKMDIHGKELLLAGMLGYVQTDNFSTWSTRINNYIEEEIQSSSIDVVWDRHDLLALDTSNTLYATYGSKHLRLSGSEIDLYHLWLNLQ